MVATFLSLGSNLGDRKSYLDRGIQGLTAHGIEVVRVAAIYETEPREVTDHQPWFLNTIVQAETKLAPDQLMQACLTIERANQRVRSSLGSARTLDIDIVFYADRIIETNELHIPHPRFSQRKFVLIPLAELAPAFVDPLTGTTVAELLRRCPDTSTVRLLQQIP